MAAHTEYLRGETVVVTSNNERKYGTILSARQYKRQHGHRGGMPAPDYKRWHYIIKSLVDGQHWRINENNISTNFTQADLYELLLLKLGS